MKKIPTVFEREFENGKVKTIKDIIPKDLQKAFYFGDATEN